MHKSLIPAVVSLLLCGAGATALVMSTANAEPSGHRPLMTAALTTAPGLQLAANDGPPPPPGPRGDRGGPPPGPPPGPMTAERIKQVCSDMVARQSGRLAYLETRLELTSAQQAPFQRWKDVRLASAKRRADACGQMLQTRNQARATPAERPNPAERMAREEILLKQRLADIQAERPALEALYNSLSPQQKAALGNGRGGQQRGGLRPGDDRRGGGRGGFRFRN